jgi:hypothetical protein
MTKKKKKERKVSQVTILGDETQEQSDIVVRFQYDNEGNLVIGADMDKLKERMNIEAILEQPIIDKYESMFASLIHDTGTKDMWQHAFFDVYLYALAHTIKKEQEEEDE